MFCAPPPPPPLPLAGCSDKHALCCVAFGGILLYICSPQFCRCRFVFYTAALLESETFPICVNCLVSFPPTLVAYPPPLFYTLLVALTILPRHVPTSPAPSLSMHLPAPLSAANIPGSRENWCKVRRVPRRQVGVQLDTRPPGAALQQLCRCTSPTHGERLPRAVRLWPVHVGTGVRLQGMMVTDPMAVFWLLERCAPCLCRWREYLETGGAKRELDNDTAVCSGPFNCCKRDVGVVLKCRATLLISFYSLNCILRAGKSCGDKQQ